MYTPSQIRDADARLREALKRFYGATWSVRSAEHSLCYAANRQRVQRHWEGNRTVWTLDGVEATLSDIEDVVRQTADSGPGDPTNRMDPVTHAKNVLERVDRARDDLALADREVSAVEREWRDNGQWGRFYAVRGGRVHASPDCRSLKRGTGALPIPELSGASVSTAVSDFGPCLCSACFPAAPKDWTGHKYITPKMRDFYTQRAQRQADREAKKIIDPATGKPLVGYSRHRWIRTERTAHNMVIEALTDLRRYGVEHPDAEKWLDYVDRAIPAIAAKRGLSDLDALRREYDDKAYTKYARELRKQSA
jgi:hypothetical protein